MKISDYTENILIFHDPGHIMKGARILKKNNIFREIIPLPKEVSSLCGICLVIKHDNLKDAESLLNEHNLSYSVKIKEDVT